MGKSPISAQSSDTISVKKIVLIKKIDGGEFIGEIISSDDREILIKTKTTIGRLYISKSDISSISFINVIFVKMAVMPIDYGHTTKSYSQRYDMHLRVVPLLQQSFAGL